MAKKATSITQRAATALADARRRGHARASLALRVGTFVMNEIEHGGQCSIDDYTTVTPRWILARYHHRRR